MRETTRSFFSLVKLPIALKNGKYSPVRTAKREKNGHNACELSKGGTVGKPWPKTAERRGGGSKALGQARLKEGVAGCKWLVISTKTTTNIGKKPGGVKPWAS